MILASLSGHSVPSLGCVQGCAVPQSKNRARRAHRSKNRSPSFMVLAIFVSALYCLALVPFGARRSQLRLCLFDSGRVGCAATRSFFYICRGVFCDSASWIAVGHSCQAGFMACKPPLSIGGSYIPVGFYYIWSLARHRRFDISVLLGRGADVGGYFPRKSRCTLGFIYMHSAASISV